jgi:ketosteroid isomerase-like protein
VTRDELGRWLAAYERAWRSPGTETLADLFTEDVVYRMSPYDPGAHGLGALTALWEREREGPDEEFTMAPTVVAVEGDVGVARVEVRYGGAGPRDYLDVWLVRFSADGRCAEFEEWPYWPGLGES